MTHEAKVYGKVGQYLGSIEVNGLASEDAREAVECFHYEHESLEICKQPANGKCAEFEAHAANGKSWSVEIR